MGQISAAVATVHTPYIKAMVDKVDKATGDKVFKGFESLGDSIRSVNPDALVVFTSEHVLNMTPRCAPPFLIGTGPEHPIFHEPAFKLPAGALRGAPEIAAGLIKKFDSSGIDVAHSVHLKVDHGTVLPLDFMGLAFDFPVVPIVTNTMFPPLPSLARSYALGRAVADFVESDDCEANIALVATGGIAHSVGEPAMAMGIIDEEFDDLFLEALMANDDELLMALSPERISAAGNGTNEIRNWLALRGAVPDWKAHQVLTERRIEPWLTGVHQVRWTPPGQNK